MLVSENKENMGKMEFSKALNIARSKGLDIFCIAPSANPPVCKLGDYFKYKYEMRKKLKSFKKANSAGKVKQIRFRANIAKNDLNIKANKAIAFLKDGFKVNVSLSLWGRQMQNIEEFTKSIYEFINIVSEYGEPVTKEIKKRNNFFEILINPIKRKTSEK